MKKIIVISLMISALTMLYPLSYALREPDLGALWYQPSPVITLRTGNGAVSMTLEEYLVGAVGAEMPASFEEEALKAQAVALRTYAMRKKYVEPSANHGETVCDDIGCCAAWLSDEALRERWGGAYDLYIQKIRAAVDATRGEYLSYGGEIALAVFHSSSPGRTEASENVWQEAVPYLISVPSPESAETVPNFVTETRLSAEEFEEIIRESFGDADFSSEPADWIRGAVYSESGRLSEIEIAGVRLTGAELRRLFGLRSADITVEATDDGVVLTSVGYGHGVGMSQYGANVMASEGSDYREILASYYPGTEVREI